ncbi:tRNA pseudouridine synthase II, TruB [Syntrophomonas zehnderi OL-4]|uniref:tRNA pseudouridine synthase B n=1 Tax=Syntrophomonas zehnderi OL-4 TaxID=690567 RepID=A0A0E4GAT3_9FIRM|nr:tRNA pseudouridine(55) synthase TruB [Syntrophomonas zehnderi]CFX67772.1 tRNA pseudouridine synthase II, TruB [Syntrophomonas zehnderi OL-4]
MDGFICINKGQGPTSFAVLKKLQKIFPPTKMGHLGTLDPMAEGVLPVALGQATRLIEYIPDSDKTYCARMTIGAVSDTQDAWGNIVATGPSYFDLADLTAILQDFTGIIQQVPPMFSAVHHQGKRLYELARQGIEVERPSRTIAIKTLELLDIGHDEAGRPFVDLEVECSQGTYIRTLCHDIGQRLGTGAYMSRLVRTRAGIFRLEDAHTLEELEQLAGSFKDIIKPLDYPLKSLPAIYLREPADIFRIQNGSQAAVDSDINADLVRVYMSAETEPASLLAIGRIITQADSRYIKPQKVLKTN